MSPLDMSVMLFFILIGVKAFKDSLDFWKDQDAQASAAHNKVIVPSKHTVSTQIKRTRVVTRTPVRVPYRICRADMNHTVSLPAQTHKKIPSSRGAGRQLETAA